MKYFSIWFIYFFRIKWLLGAVKNCNPELKLNASLTSFCLDSISRIDISNNNLITLPSELFSMGNLRRVFNSSASKSIPTI